VRLTAAAAVPPASAAPASFLIVAACDMPSQPGAARDKSSEGGTSLQTAQTARGIAGEFLRIEGKVPGFDGLSRNADGDVVVRFNDLVREEEARAEFEAYRSRNPSLMQGFNGRAARVIVERADYPFSKLIDWKLALRRSASAEHGIRTLDADELRNRVTLGVLSGTPSARVLALAEAVGVPRSAVYITELSSVPQIAASVRDYRRPTVGGIQIARPVFQGLVFCRIGYHVRTSTAAVYALTASHCTGQYSNSVGQQWFQNDTETWGTIATQTVR